MCSSDLLKAGILSDTHDQRGGAEEALALFLREGVGVILHLGDVCRPGTILAFRDCGIPLIGVFGNNDYDKEGLQAVSGNAFHPGPHMPEIDGRKILMSHSFDELQEEIGEGGKFDRENPSSGTFAERTNEENRRMSKPYDSTVLPARRRSVRRWMRKASERASMSISAYRFPG